MSESDITTFVSLTCSDAIVARFYLDMHEQLDAAVDAFWIEQAGNPADQPTSQSSHSSQSQSQSRKRRRIIGDDNYDNDDGIAAPLAAFEDQLVVDASPVHRSIDQSNARALNRVIQTINQSKPRQRVPINQSIDLTRDFKREFQQSNDKQSVKQPVNQQISQSSSSLDNMFAEAASSRRLVVVFMHMASTDLLIQQLVKGADAVRNLDVAFINLKLPTKSTIIQAIATSDDATKFTVQYRYAVRAVPHLSLIDARTKQRIYVWEPVEASMSVDKRISAVRNVKAIIAKLLADIAAIIAPYDEVRKKGSRAADAEAAEYACVIAESLEEDEVEDENDVDTGFDNNEDVIQQTPEASHVKISPAKAPPVSQTTSEPSNPSIKKSHIVPPEPTPSPSVTTLRLRLPTTTVTRRFERTDPLLNVLHFVASLLPAKSCSVEHIKLITALPRRVLTIEQASESISALKLENSALIAEVDEDHKG